MGGDGAVDIDVEVRVAETDEELEAWRRVRLAVLPNERARSVEEMRAMALPVTLYLIAHVDGELVGSGLAGRSDFGYAGLHPRVVPDWRRRGVGTAILRTLEAHALAHGFAEAGSNLDDVGSLAFAERFGLREVDRQVEQTRVIAPDEPWPDLPEGIVVVTVAERPELWPAAYDPFALEVLADFATDRPIQVTREQWERDWLDWPEAMFLALDGDAIVGCAGLERDDDVPDRAEHALTAVARSWRRRGLATTLKRMTLAAAAQHGIREVYTWTQRGNADMRALNERLGFVTRSESITVRGPLPLTWPGS
jgi:GNAT superfamily N-acetyltransferase